MLWRKTNHHAAIQHFSYDDEQRVSAITFEGHSEFERIEFCYDIFGRRREKRVYRHAQDTPEIIEFFWTGAKMTGECSSARPGEMTQYHYSEDSWEPIARTDSTEYGENTYWYHCGLNGLPTEMSNASGKVVWRGEDNLWGEISDEISHFSTNAVQQNLRFQGQYLDRETGLHYNLFRYYDPVARRFTQPDPIGLNGGINTYQYAPNALAWVDPLGLAKCPTIIRGTNGEITSARATVSPADLKTGTAVNSSARNAIKAIGLPGDDAGHILGKVLGGQGGKGNLFPQLSKINRGDYRMFEKSVRDYISQHGAVDIEWTFKYAYGGLRPTGVQYDVYQNGYKILGDFFRNI